MTSLSKSFPLVFIFLFALLLFVTVIRANADPFIPPVPDQTKTLPAHDGGPDGCDSSRFKCVMEGKAVLDNQTGLVWSRDSQSIGERVSWEEAVNLCQNIKIGGQKEWRLPTRDELISLLDTSQSYPALPEGHPFWGMNNIPQGGPESNRQYWTSTECEGNNQCAWMIELKVGKVFDSLKWFDYKIWPVRDSE